jgi:hypothetical protein
MTLLFVPIGLQAFAMLFDEFYFHHKRGLPNWERIGHPIDTFFVLICYLYLLYWPPSGSNLNIYISLCAFSSLLITKDEFIHTELCEPSENWLHSVLFILHPLTFFSAGLLWWNHAQTYFLMIQAFALMLFMIYQIFYWSYYEKSKQRSV